MTAVLIVAQPKYGLLHVATDAAMYSPDQNVQAFGPKAHAIPHWPGVVTALGNTAACVLFHNSLSQEFSSFDDFVERGESILPGLMSSWVMPHDLPIVVDGLDMIVGGYSVLREQPEAYSWTIDDHVPPGATAAEKDASPFYDAPYRLVRLPNVTMSPVPSDQVIPANYEGIDVDADPEIVTWSIRKVLEMQRHGQLPEGIGGIGGFVNIATIDVEGVRQSVLHRWLDDKTGGPLKPEPIDWSLWHRDNPKPESNVDLTSLSRLQRERRLKKMKKGTLR